MSAGYDYSRRVYAEAYDYARPRLASPMSAHDFAEWCQDAVLRDAVRGLSPVVIRDYGRELAAWLDVPE